VPLSDITTCLVCEIIRPEEGGKLSLLGFYGILPDIEIQVADSARPISGLSFVFLGHYSAARTPDEAFNLSIRLTSPKGTTIVETPPVSVHRPVQGKLNATVAAGIGSVVLPEPGQYGIELTVDGANLYSSHFYISPRVLS
jgi:hypothetical protein